ncbi:MAG: transposase, partial [Ruminococcus sp.]|nr:transposase [Ruminococcus sp.]
LDYCGKLYEIEKKMKDESSKDKLKERQEQSKPLLDAFFAWAKSLRNIAPKSKLGKAINYLIEEEPYLRRYLEDGSLESDNSRAERSIKPFVIGRKNWLFANTPSGAKASATAFSIIETAKGNGLDPYEYLKFIFTKAPNLKDNESIDILLPWNAPDNCRSNSATLTTEIIPE